jgi:peptidoglycan/xylan/chitin deacetylase (PgdA/CDA1 family)
VSRMIALMYHGLYRDEAELEAIDPEDRPYAVELGDFARHLDAIERSASVAGSLRALETMSPGATDRAWVLLTFDDGHGSNHALALPELERRGWRATFFVTSDFIGRRRDYCTAAQLRELARHGMTVGSHGKTHRFLDALSDTELDEEIRGSKGAIEDCTGVAVDSISFPGGRYDERALRMGGAAGLRYFFTSEVGANETSALAHGGMVRRVAIRRGTRADELEALIRDPRILLRAAWRSRAKSIVRRALGNRLYHGLYRRLA